MEAFVLSGVVLSERTVAPLVLSSCIAISAHSRGLAGLAVRPGSWDRLLVQSEPRRCQWDGLHAVSLGQSRQPLPAVWVPQLDEQVNVHGSEVRRPVRTRGDGR